LNGGMGKENFISSSTDVACNFGSQPHGGICFGVKDEGALAQIPRNSRAS